MPKDREKPKADGGERGARKPKFEVEMTNYEVRMFLYRELELEHAPAWEKKVLMWT